MGDLSKVAHVEFLMTDRATYEVVPLVRRPAAVELADDQWPEV